MDGAQISGTGIGQTAQKRPDFTLLAEPGGQLVRSRRQGRSCGSSLGVLAPGPPGVVLVKGE